MDRERTRRKPTRRSFFHGIISRIPTPFEWLAALLIVAGFVALNWQRITQILGDLWTIYGPLPLLAKVTVPVLLALVVIAALLGLLKKGETIPKPIRELINLVSDLITQVRELIERAARSESPKPPEDPEKLLRTVETKLPTPDRPYGMGKPHDEARLELPPFLVGRQQSVEAVVGRLSAPTTGMPVTAVVGFSGTGKTAVVAEAVYQLKDTHFEDGIAVLVCTELPNDDFTPVGIIRHALQTVSKGKYPCKRPLTHYRNGLCFVPDAEVLCVAHEWEAVARLRAP